MKGSQRLITVALALAVVATALATPAIDSAVIKSRIWNAASYSTFTSTNLYPANITMMDAGLDQTGWANRHNFRLSDNGGISEAVFMNNDGFAFATDVTITGTANVEGGLNVSPWWSKDVDGVFMVRTDDGEISCWGGRLPFFNFTAQYGIQYVKGETVRLGVAYSPNGLSDVSPAPIQYSVVMNGTTYTSPVLSFDEGNPSEDPPYGLWGMLNDARVGGWFMPKVNNAIPGNWAQIEFANSYFVPEPASLVLLGVASLLIRRR